MSYIDEKFKDDNPVSTAKKIHDILKKNGIDVVEKWHSSGVENCFSLTLYANNGIPSSNGKGVSEEFARASAYGEFIERLQNGLFLYKYQSIMRNRELNIHLYASDVRYFSVRELIEKGDWMDHIVDAYGGNLTRESLAELCRIFAFSQDDRIPAVPYYSLFEKRNVYLPIGFVEQMYTANGCCAGNSREEAWIHALSEIMERHCALRVLTSGKAVNKISNKTLSSFATVSNIIEKIKSAGQYDVQVLDYSLEDGFPVVATRIINKDSHGYRVSEAADPILEIAIQRTLTELFQGCTVQNVTETHQGIVLNCVTDYPIATNVINQLETASGYFTADFFADSKSKEKEQSDFISNTNKTNKELLKYVLETYSNMGKQIYIRNLSYLGFPSYKIIVPGFSETRSVWLNEIVPDYAMADEASKIMRNAVSSSDDDLNWMLSYSTTTQGIIGRYNKFCRSAGVPLSGWVNHFLASLTYAYASYRLNRYRDAVSFMKSFINSCSDEGIKGYFECVNRYLQMKSDKIDDDKIRVVLYKFFHSRFVNQLYANLDQGNTPYDEYLISCDFKSCDKCRYSEFCSYNSIKEMNQRVGAVYSTFVNGQDPSEFAI